MSVCLISYHPLVLENFQRALARHGVQLQGRQVRAMNPTELRALQVPRADLFIIDLGAPVTDAERLVSTIIGRRPTARVIALAEQFKESTAFPLLRLGVRGLLTYAVAERQLPHAVRQVGAGGYWVGRDLLHRFTESILSKGSRGVPRRAPGLSVREQQVMAGVLENLSNKEIAARLHISERTVKFHMSNLLGKFGVQRRADLILLSFQQQTAAIQ